MSPPCADISQRFEASTAGDKWRYAVPDMIVGGSWHTARLNALKEAVRREQGPPSGFADGVRDLAHHRENYGPAGPQHLVVFVVGLATGALDRTLGGSLHELHGRPHSGVGA